MKALLLVLIASLAYAEQVTIVHTNDLHAQLLPAAPQAGGVAYLASAIRREMANCSHCVHLDGGDFVQGTPVSTLFKGDPIWEFANTLHVDAAVLGNHDFDYGASRIPKYLSIARFPLLCANVVDAAGKPIAQPYIIQVVNGVRVAIIGITMEHLPAFVSKGVLDGWSVLPSVETAKKYAALVRPKSDLTVLLVHTTDQEDDALLREVADAGVIIAGHNHIGLDEPKVSGRRVLVKVKARGVEYGKLDLQVNRANRTFTWTWAKFPVNPEKIPSAPDVSAMVDRWEAKVSATVNIPVGESKRALTQSELRPVLERAMAEETGADFGFMNEGGVRAPMSQGTILARHIWNVIPFDNVVILMKAKGSALPAMIAAGRTISPDRTYTVALPDFVADKLSGAGITFESTGQLQRDVVLNWVKKRKGLE